MEFIRVLEAYGIKSIKQLLEHDIDTLREMAVMDWEMSIEKSQVFCSTIAKMQQRVQQRSTMRQSSRRMIREDGGELRSPRTRMRRQVSREQNTLAGTYKTAKAIINRRSSRSPPVQGKRQGSGNGFSKPPTAWRTGSLVQVTDEDYGDFNGMHAVIIKGGDGAGKVGIQFADKTAYSIPTKSVRMVQEAFREA